MLSTLSTLPQIEYFHVREYAFSNDIADQIFLLVFFSLSPHSLNVNVTLKY